METDEDGQEGCGRWVREAEEKARAEENDDYDHFSALEKAGEEDDQEGCWVREGEEKARAEENDDHDHFSALEKAGEEDDQEGCWVREGEEKARAEENDDHDHDDQFSAVEEEKREYKDNDHDEKAVVEQEEGTMSKQEEQGEVIRGLHDGEEWLAGSMVRKHLELARNDTDWHDEQKTFLEEGADRVSPFFQVQCAR